MLATLLVLLGLVTIADEGLVFQPALSPDGAFVVYARAEADGSTTLHVRASSGATPAVEVARTRAPIDIVARYLFQRPWSADSAWIVYPAPTEVGGVPGIVPRVVGRDGTGDRAAGPSEGYVEVAAFAARGDRFFCTHRGALGDDHEVLFHDLASNETRTMRAEKGEVVAEVAPSPDDRSVALLVLSGDPLRRERALRILDLATGDAKVVPASSRANLLRWSADGRRLFFLDVVERQVFLYDTDLGQTHAIRDAGDAVAATPIGDGGAVVGAARDGSVFTVAIGGERRSFAVPGLVPTSAAGGKVAFVRRAGAAVIVADVDVEESK